MFGVDVDVSGGDGAAPTTNAIAQSLARGSKFDASKFKFVVSPTEDTPGLIVSADVPLDQYNFSDSNDVFELWSDPDVIQLRGFFWSAGSEDKPTELDYNVPLLHMLPEIRRRFATQLMPGGNAGGNAASPSIAARSAGGGGASPALSRPADGKNTNSNNNNTSSRNNNNNDSNNNDNDNDDDDNDDDSKSPGFIESFLAARRANSVAASMPELTLRLCESGMHGRTFWLTTARSLRDQGCTPQVKNRFCVQWPLLSSLW